MNLSICYITSRPEPKIEWFLDSLAYQIKPNDHVHLIVVDLFERPVNKPVVFDYPFSIKVVPPKPNIWQGKHRLMKKDWWGISTARNTGICLCTTDWIAFCDDRCVLAPNWLQAVREAQKHGYAIAGSYEKWYGLKVVEGQIISADKCTTKDHRAETIGRDGPKKIPGQWWFGCTSALPLEWALKINGWDERCDSLGLEDNLFGTMVQNNGYPIRFDRRMKIIEDRTPYSTEGLPKRTDKGVSPNDKSHALLYMLQGLKRANPDMDLSAIRNTVLAGGSFPIPKGPVIDWYDGTPITDMDNLP